MRKRFRVHSQRNYEYDGRRLYYPIFTVGTNIYSCFFEKLEMVFSLKVNAEASSKLLKNVQKYLHQRLTGEKV